jgi:hypothetical protein
MTIIRKLHILRKIQPLDRRDVSEIKEPDIGEDFALEDETRNDPAEDVDVDFEVCGCVDHGQLFHVHHIRTGFIAYERWKGRG